MKKYLITLALGLLVLAGCKEKTYGPIATDGVPPKPIKIDSVVSIPGGAEIKFTSPEDVDFAYVKAVFDRHGKKVETRASAYTNKLTIEGLADTTARKVEFYSVDLSENVSEPVSETIYPLTPPYLDVFSTIDIAADFGGAVFQWKNKTGQPVEVEIFAEDSVGVLRSKAVLPSLMEMGVTSLRGFDTIPTRFGALVFDKWGNYTPDTLVKTVTPWYEEEFNKEDWQFLYLPYDEDWSAWGTRDVNMFNDNTSDFCHTWGGGYWPPAFTIDLGSVKKLSRMKLWMRSSSQPFYYWTHGNPKQWKIFGRVDKPDPNQDVQYVDDETWENLGWTLLIDNTPGNNEPEFFTMIRPTENGGSPEEDEAEALNGSEFIFDISNPNVRYLRFIITKTWDGANYVTFSELSIFGASVNN